MLSASDQNSTALLQSVTNLTSQEVLEANTTILLIDNGSEVLIATWLEKSLLPQFVPVPELSSSQPWPCLNIIVGSIRKMRAVMAMVALERERREIGLVFRITPWDISVSLLPLNPQLRH
jgi:hypothetical protein